MSKLFYNIIFWLLLLTAVFIGALAIHNRIQHQDSNPFLISIAVFVLILSGLIFDKNRKIKKRINRIEKRDEV
jgi:putative effector of murein hydrolase